MRLKSSARGSGPGLASPNPTDIAIGAGRGKAAAQGTTSRGDMFDSDGP